MSRFLHRVATGMLLGAAASVNAQQPTPAAPRVLAVTNANANAAREFSDGLGAFYHWSNGAAFDHLNRALEADNTFGVARVWRARVKGGPTARAEIERGVAEASRGSALEVLLALATREFNQGRAPAARTVLDAAVALAPDDPNVAWEHANARPSLAERLDAFRALNARFPQYAPGRMTLAALLAPLSFDTIAAGSLDEALRVSAEALQLAPRAPGAHAVRGNVLVRAGRVEEGLTHLDHATSMSPAHEFAFESKADVATHRGQPAVARAYLDSAASRAANVTARSTLTRNRALLFLHDGKLREALAAMDTLARAEEAAGMNGAASATHGWMALIAAGARDSVQAAAHQAESRRLGATDAAQAENDLITALYTRQGALAQNALPRYIAAQNANANLNAAVREANIHRFTGLALVAQGKGREAVAELKLGGTNPYAQVGLIEAYRQFDKKAFEAEKAAFLARTNWTYQSTAYAIEKYRLLYAR